MPTKTIVSESESHSKEEDPRAILCKRYRWLMVPLVVRLLGRKLNGLFATLNSAPKIHRVRRRNMFFDGIDSK